MNYFFWEKHQLFLQSFQTCGRQRGISPLPIPLPTFPISLFPLPHQGDWSQAITLHVTVPGGGVVGISEGAGVSSVGVSFAGGLSSETAAVAAGVSFGGAAPKLTEKWKKTMC